MFISNYTDIIIDGDQFSIVEGAHKSQDEGFALTTLNRIEEVMRRGLKYSAIANKNYSSMSKSELRERLRLKAESIRDGYLNKSHLISHVRRFFGGIAQKERDIQSVYTRIENLASPPPLFELSNEMIQHICGFLQAGDLGKLDQVNKHSTNHVHQAEVQRAREYGYSRHDLAEAKDYLKNLFQTIETLVKDKFIPKEYVVHRGRWPFWRYVDAEATLRNMRHLSGDKEAELKVKLNKALLYYSGVATDVKVCRAVIQLGADLNVRDQSGRTALALAAIKDRREVVELLVTAGADPNTTTLLGNTPLIHTTCNFGSPEIARLLLENGASAMINHVGNHGNNALHFAARFGQVEIVKLLIEYGADKSLLNAQGKTALELAQNRRIRKLLQ
jgi:hypothetical protein